MCPYASPLRGNARPLRSSRPGDAAAIGSVSACREGSAELWRFEDCQGAPAPRPGRGLLRPHAIGEASRVLDDPNVTGHAILSISARHLPDVSIGAP